MSKSVEEPDTRPYSAFSVKFPYSCTFTIADDDHNTRVTISTRSEAVRYGYDEQDVMKQSELDKLYGSATYAKHIIEWVGERLRYTDPRTVDVDYDGETTFEAMTDDDIDEFRESCLEE